MSFVWLLLIVAFILVESFTYQLICIWFAAGGIGALIASLITDNYMIQIAVFTAVSAIMLICLRPLIKRGIRTEALKTNVDDLPGKEVIITDDVCNLQAKGKGMINGMEWSVRSIDDSEIKKGTAAVVVKVEGVKLIVKEQEK